MRKASKEKHDKNDPDVDDISTASNVKNVFGSEENALRASETIRDAIFSYGNRNKSDDLKEWVVKELEKHQSVFPGRVERDQLAEEIISTVKGNYDRSEDLRKHLEKGKSKESWIGAMVEAKSTAASVESVGQYASGIDYALKQSNDTMFKTINRKDGVIKESIQLHGFIGEAEHVISFNNNAAEKGSLLRAEMQASNNKNSVDILIRDEGDKIIQKYGVKYGSDSVATESYLKKGDYRGQRKLVPKGQAEDISGATDFIECDGVQSNPLSYEKAKQIQKDAQIQREIKTFSWDSINKYEICKSVGKQALIMAGFSAAIQGAVIFGNRLWNKISGQEKKNQPISEDVKSFVDGSLDSAKSLGVQTAVSTGVIIAARSGWIRILQNTPAAPIVNAVYVAMENTKILYKVAKGELTTAEGFDLMGQTSLTASMGIIAAGRGAILGNLILPGIGAVIGGIIGGMAGVEYGKKIYSASKKVYEAAKPIISKVYEKSKNAINFIKDIALQPLRLFN